MPFTKSVASRIPIDLYFKLVEEAKKQNMNINDFLLLIISEKFNIVTNSVTPDTPFKESAIAYLPLSGNATFHITEEDLDSNGNLIIQEDEHTNEPAINDIVFWINNYLMGVIVRTHPLYVYVNFGGEKDMKIERKSLKLRVNHYRAYKMDNKLKFQKLFVWDCPDE